MYANILVPVDLGGKAEPALGRAVALADETGAVVTLLHVIETIEGVEFEELEDFYERLDETANRRLREWTAGVIRDGLNVRHVIRYGRRGPEIVRFAEQDGCDLIVVRSHRVDPESPGAGLGTLSHQVAVLAGCAVLMVR